MDLLNPKQFITGGVWGIQTIAPSLLLKILTKVFSSHKIVTFSQCTVPGMKERLHFSSSSVLAHFFLHIFSFVARFGDFSVFFCSILRRAFLLRRFSSLQFFFWKSDLKYHFNIGWNDFNLWFFENYVFICDIISIFFVYKGSYHSTKRYKKNGKSRKINRKCLKQLFFLEKEQGWKETKLMDKAFCFLFFVFCFIRFGSFFGGPEKQ